MQTPRQRWLRAVLLVAVITAFFGIARAQDPSASAKPDDNSSRKAGEGAGEAASVDTTEMVRFRGEPIFEVRAQLGPLTPAERAVAINQRLGRIVGKGEDVLKDIRVEERKRSSDILAGDQYIISVTDADALPTGRTRQQLAADYVVTLRRVLTREFRGRSFQGLVIGVVVSILATLVLAALLFYVNRLAPRLRSAIRAAGMHYMHAARFRGKEMLTASSVADVLVQVSRFLEALLVLVAVLIYLEIVLSAFPWTRETASQLLGTLQDAFALVTSGLFGYLPNVFYIAVILFVTHYLLRFARVFFVAVSRGSITLDGFYPEWAMPSYKIVRFLAYAFAAVVVFPYLPGSGSPAFQGVSIFLGVLFSLGSTSAIANMVAGIVLTYMRPFREGDRVKIADTIGDIIEKNLLVVRVRTIKNVEITIPNSMVLNNHIINFSACARKPGLILHSTVTIGYDTPWREVHELLVAAARRTDGVQGEPAPFVLQTALNDFFVSYELNAFTDQPNQMASIYSALHQNIQDEFNRAGVEITSPHFVAARDGNRLAIPDEHLPKDYNPPAFRVTPLPPSPPGPGPTKG